MKERSDVISVYKSVGFLSLCDILSEAWIFIHEAKLAQATGELLESFSEVRQIGTASNKAAVFSFVMEGAHPNDIGMILDREGIAIRTGHHCTQPLLARFGVSATARASFGLYNSLDEVAAFGRGLEKVMRMFA